MAPDTRARMVATTSRLLEHRGYHGTALSDIIAESGAPRGSLYFHFPGGKDQLVLEATRAGVARATEGLRAALAGGDAVAGVRALIAGTARALRESDYTFGCPVSGVVLDAPAVPGLAELCGAAFDEWRAVFRDGLVAGGVPRARAAVVALWIASSLQGCLVIARASRDHRIVLTIGRELEAMIARELPRRRRPRGTGG
jgi:TetR/AcrR family transcriptional regulator, lmrAB and yxaGH operons repressor